jgi:hypothetical protein
MRFQRLKKLNQEIAKSGVDGGEKPGHFGGVEVGQGVGYAWVFSKPEKRPGGPAGVLL